MDGHRTKMFLQAVGLVLAQVLAIGMLPYAAQGEESAAVQQSQRIRQIVLSRGDNPAALAQLIQLSKDMEAPAAAQLYRQLADDFLKVGHYEQAGNVLRQLVGQFAEQPIAIDGLIASVQINSSSEVSHSLRTTVGRGDIKSAATYALNIAEQALKKQPGLTDNPALAFQCAVAARLSGKPSQGWLTALKHNTRMQPWNLRTEAESWLNDPRKDSPPKETLVCPLASERPHLDGVLDELRWQSAGSAVIAPAEQNQGAGFAKVQLSRDEDFLYLAIYCAKSSGSDYLADRMPRAHDADLSKHDRVEIELDVDRDYATVFKLSVDHRGQTADQCWHDRSWNPRWFVASRQDETHWTIEAAIAWEELTAVAPVAGDAWALSLKRLLPGQEPQSWAGGSATVVDEFGLVVFE